MSPKNIFLFTFCTTIIFSACNKSDDLYDAQPDNTVTQTDYSTIDPAFEKYVDRFIAEGAKRGFSIDLASKDITIQFTNIDQTASPNVVGMCSYDGQIHHDITIDYNFWQQADDLMKEFILFHELGHCYLGRGHLDTAFGNGICTSIMRGANPGCIDAYTVANRDYYIDELFSIAYTGEVLS